MTTAPPPLEVLRASLLENLKNPSQSYWDSIEAQAAEALRKWKAAGDEQQANRAWFLKTIAGTHRDFVGCFTQIKAGDFYKAWCELERIEIALPWLLTNRFFDPASYEVEGFLAQVKRWQSLYPYKVFFSPGILKKRKECSICRQPIDPWTECEHEVGRVYVGEECCGIVTEVEFIEISLVLDPVQKYSVVMLANDESGSSIDHYDYSIVGFLADRLNSPFDNWDVQWTSAYHPHDMFPNTASGDVCPCGSGHTFSGCCQLRPGVIRPHAQFTFEKEPPNGIPSAHFAG